MKDKNQSPINFGFDAIRNSRHIGHGVDVSLRWLILSDLSFFANYAIFIPLQACGRPYYISGGYLGNAIYRKENNRHFIMGGFNISF